MQCVVALAVLDSGVVEKKKGEQKLRLNMAYFLPFEKRVKTKTTENTRKELRERHQSKEGREIEHGRKA